MLKQLKGGFSILTIAFSLFHYSCSQASVVEYTIVDFNDIVSSSSNYISNGYLFSGYAYPGENIRVYSNQILTISRVDGGFFGLESFQLVHNDTRHQDWRVQNQGGLGFVFRREQTYYPRQSASFDSISAVIFPGNKNHTYMILDNFVFSHVSSVPVPTTLWLFGSAIFGWMSFGRCKSTVI